MLLEGTRGSRPSLSWMEIVVFSSVLSAASKSSSELLHELGAEDKAARRAGGRQIQVMLLKSTRGSRPSLSWVKIVVFASALSAASKAVPSCCMSSALKTKLQEEQAEDKSR